MGQGWVESKAGSEGGDTWWGWIDRFFGASATCQVQDGGLRLATFWPNLESWLRLARVAAHPKQPAVYFLAPLPQGIFSGRELIAWSSELP
jgi:hypothetical protein